MKRPLIAIALFGVVASAVLLSVPSAPELVIEPAPAAPAALEADRTTVALPIRRGSTFGKILGDAGLPATAIRSAALDHYDLARIRPDRDLQVVYTDGKSDVVEVRYAVDGDHTVVVERTDAGWQSHMYEIAYSSSLVTRQVVLTRSLWADGLDAGLRPEDLALLAQIFEYELDFNSELQSGAVLSIVAEQMQSETGKTRLGAVHAVRIVNKGKEYTALRHVVGDKEGFYHPDGTGMQRPFLRSPLAFSARVTSSFNPNRFHPVLKKRRPHNGTDFGAPTGTKVRTVASGTVTYAARNGGHGNYVKVRHDNGYETSYSHLSRILVRRGQRVGQGAWVGKVGSTGMSTGPHLHWQMWRGGRYVDAMKTRMPVSTPIPRSERAAFEALVSKWMPMLDEDGVADSNP